MNNVLALFQVSSLANSCAQGKQSSLVQNSTAPHPSPPPHGNLAHQIGRHLLELLEACNALQTLDPRLIGHHRGKGTPRRKVKKVQRNAGTDDKKLQAALKKLNVQPIQAIEEVNMFKSDGNVIHFSAPKGGSRPFHLPRQPSRSCARRRVQRVQPVSRAHAPVYTTSAS